MRSIRIAITVLALVLACGLVEATVQAQDADLAKRLVKLPDGKVCPAPGYTWLNELPRDLQVRWVPGVRHPLHINVVSAAKEGNWTASPGFRWANERPGDFTVLPALAQPSQEAVGRAIVKILGAAVADAVAVPGKDDGILEKIFRQVARNGRDELIESAVEDVFPGMDGAAIRAVRRVICLGLDGQLDQQNWQAATARDELLARLRRENPDLANAAQAADFIARVLDARSR